MNRIPGLNAFCLFLLLSSCHILPGNAQHNQAANAGINAEIIQLYKGIHLTETTNCCDTATHSTDKSFICGRCISMPGLTGQSSAIANLNNHISEDYKLVTALCGTEIKDQENFLKTAYKYFVEDSLLSLVIETQNAWHLSEGTSEYNVYHYDLKNNRIMDTRTMLESRGMSQVPLLNAIAEQITMPPDYTEPLFQPAWFDIIKWKDINQLKVFKNSKKQLVIIYHVAENGIEAMQTIE
ncbi:MAG: hypothetical protein AB9834_21060 [Lentimicrobium sp.]